MSALSKTDADPLPIPGRDKVQSPPLDPSKLNHTPAPIPDASPANPSSDPTPAAPLRSPENPVGGDSAYLDTGLTEQPSHPTIAETGPLSLGQDGPGPSSGQLKRVERGGKEDKDIIKLGSFGGEGLVVKPPVGSPVDNKER